MNIISGQNTILTASWIGAYSWTPGGATTRSITVSPVTNTSYTVTDGNGCLSDVFNVTVSPPRIATGVSEQQQEITMTVYPNPFSGKTTIDIHAVATENPVLNILDISGKKVAMLNNGTYENGTHRFELDATALDLKAGIYFVRLQSGQMDLYEKIIVTAP